MTVGSVLLALELFWNEVSSCIDTSQEFPESWLEDPIGTILAIFVLPGDPRLSEILPLFIVGEGDPLKWPVRELMRVSLESSDLERMYEALDLNALDEQNVPTDEMPAIEVNLVRLAERFGVTPQSITGWTFEAYMSAIDVLNADKPDQPGEESGDFPGMKMRKTGLGLEDLFDGSHSGFAKA